MSRKPSSAGLEELTLGSWLAQAAFVREMLKPNCADRGTKSMLRCPSHSGEFSRSLGASSFLFKAASMPFLALGSAFELAPNICLPGQLIKCLFGHFRPSSFFKNPLEPDGQRNAKKCGAETVQWFH